ncbi:uncharacterized protein ACLA_009120 [Aspergillus clavatus NRRL 1]|uniref:CRIB domain-containing protein n=1 Tax=Aspergillus clavatus (strain ATCC 1007 / CBS 513.65 / DSM 816 / NCTC 3887 / NRRL 1 / QM 1276 / 107) TaxID=344612 RepID=A1C9S4_ASPCL|nr:uncharacterized protein ACLA_009120 [Aspergillus clavatus NRRL 1]EAW12492.1 conserved hypothetical protein [Aspergillus clavatus NRRL 1]
MTSADTASLPSQDDSRSNSSVNLRSERHESMTKSLFSRGSRILRRQGSKFNIAATLDEEEEVEREKSRFEVSDLFNRHHKSRQSDVHDSLKSLISDPFDFHHLTHTSPSQFQELDRTGENDLVTEFSAIRASQRPITELKGIRAEDLHFRGFSSEDLTNGGSSLVDHRASPTPTSPPGSPGTVSSISPKQLDSRARRESRVCENFSRPVAKYSRATSTTPPPRATSPQLTPSPDMSEPAPRAIDEILGLSSQPTYPEHVYGNSSDAERTYSLSHINVEGMILPEIAQGLIKKATPETVEARTSSVSLPSLSSVLEEVPEELSSTHWHDSPDANARGAEVPISPGTQRKSQLSISVAEELSQKFTEALGSPVLPQYRLFQSIAPNDQMVGGPVRRRSSARRKPTYETIYESWDADIDYCYEHAAESTCNFDWSRNSLDEPRSTETDNTLRAVSGGTRLDQDARLLQPIHLSTSSLPTPDLDPSPSRSLMSSQVAVTPSSAEYETEIVAAGGADYFQPVNFSPALGKQIPQDTLYEEYLEADSESDRHFSFCPQGLIHGMEHPVSPRSSFSPISKCNSQESLILSRTASIVHKHRSSISTTSVPELVHSLASSRELSSMEHLPSSDQPGPPEAPSHRRPTKSLAREIETQIMRAERNCSPNSADLAQPAGSVHDRAKSVSEVEASRTARAVKGTASAPFPPIPVKSPNRKKGRASYSLFPSAAA